MADDATASATAHDPTPTGDRGADANALDQGTLHLPCKQHAIIFDARPLGVVEDRLLRRRR